MKLETGMYVRTIYGIKKIISIMNGQDVQFDNTKGFDEDLKNHHDCDVISKFDNYFWENEVIEEPSFYPIDLIKVGDIILFRLNGDLYKQEVEEAMAFGESMLGVFMNLLDKEVFLKLTELDILKVLTKEQFNAHCFEVGD